MKLRYIIFAAFLGSGCGAKKVVVNNADIMLENQIQKRIPLYADQKEKLSKDMDKFLNEQKAFVKEAIPVITSIELDVKTVDANYGHLSALYQKLALNFSKLLSKHIATLDEKQQKEFIRNMKDEGHRISKADSEDRMERLFDRFETLFGTVSDKQKSLLNEYKRSFDKRNKERVKRREELQQRFSEVFDMDLSREAKAEYFFEAFESYQKKYSHNPENKEIIKKIVPTLSKDQREVFEEKTNDLKEILNYFLEAHY